MKILIAYASKYGTVTECVRRLQSELCNSSPTVVNLEEGSPDPSQYDILLLGTSVYFGKARPAFRQFLKEYGSVLEQKTVGLFFCCGLAHEHEYYQERIFPRSLRRSAFATLYFGGVLKQKHPSLMDRFWLHNMRSSILESEIEDFEYTPSLPGILPEAIEKMATYTKEVMIHRKSED